MAKKRIELFPPHRDAVNVGFSVKASVDDLQRLNPKQLQAFMRGLGEVMSVSNK